MHTKKNNTGYKHIRGIGQVKTQGILSNNRHKKKIENRKNK